MLLCLEVAGIALEIMVGLNRRKEGSIIMFNKVKEIICVLIGHSRIIDGFMGYWHCCRCKSYLGDTLAGCYTMKDKVVRGHNCSVCRVNYEKLTWKDKLFVKYPLYEKGG